MAYVEDKTHSIDEAIRTFFDDTTEKFKGKSPISGLATHYHDIDTLTSGLQPGELTIIAGRPSVGKTALAANLVLRVAVRSLAPVLMFTPGQEINGTILNMAATQCKVSKDYLKTGRLDDQDWIRLYEGMEILTKAPIYIHDQPRLTVKKIVDQSYSMMKNVNLKMIVVDYLQLLQPSSPRPPRDQEIADITRELKILARETNSHLILLSQLNRRVEERIDKRPMLHDLRDSGAIEDDADNIIFLYRDILYNKSEDNPLKNHAEIILAKQRNGRTGRIELFFQKEYGLFENMDPTPDPSELPEDVHTQG